MKTLVPILGFLLLGQPSINGYNYAELLQKTLFFYECQESGRLSAENRVDWKGDSFVDDGQDVGLDLSGGWNDAGDHWKANSTMARGASFLAWSVLTFPESYIDTGQMRYALNSLRHIADYFKRCIVDPHPGTANDYSGYHVYVDVGGKTTPEAPSPGVHSPWAASEVIDGYTVREPLKVNSSTPNGGVSAAMAATLAGCANVFQLHGTSNDKLLAAQLLPVARKLADFATAYPDSTGEAIRPNNAVVSNGYLDTYPYDDLIWARVWLHRASKAMGISGYTDAHLIAARTIVDDLESDGTLWQLTSWWKEHNYNHAAIMAWMQTDHNQNDADLLMPQVVQLLELWNEADPNASPDTSKFYHTPYGLKMRQVHNGTFSGQHVFRQLSIAAMFAHWTADQSEKETYTSYVQQQTDYFLGDNKQGMSYIVGFGDKGWPITQHHRDAHGSWNGHTQRSSSEDLYLGRMRHVLYGALLGGPDGNDDFTDQTFDHYYTEPIIGAAGQVQVVAAFLRSLNTHHRRLSAFPQSDRRNRSLDLDFTDREFYVGAEITSSDTVSITVNATLYNRSAWPARVTDDTRFRYYFTADDGETSANDFSLSVTSSQGGKKGSIVKVSDDLYYAEIQFPGERMLPDYRGGQQWKRSADFTISTNSTIFDSSNDFSGQGLDQTVRLLPRLPVYQGSTLLEGQVPN